MKRDAIKRLAIDLLTKFDDDSYTFNMDVFFQDSSGDETTYCGDVTGECGSSCCMLGFSAMMYPTTGSMEALARDRFGIRYGAWNPEPEKVYSPLGVFLFGPQNPDSISEAVQRIIHALNHDATDDTPATCFDGFTPRSATAEELLNELEQCSA